MSIPIVITAFGTTSKAIATYTHLDQLISPHFPENEIIWTYSSKVVGKELRQAGSKETLHPEQALKNFNEQGVKQAVVQSLHLFPGAEFHNLHKTVHNSKLPCSIGMPLFTSMNDYDEIAELLRPLIPVQKKTAILILGHGTYHPIWTAYYSLEKILRRQYGRQIYVGTVEPYPDSSHLVDDIAKHGYRKVLIIPFFLVAGFHFRRDIIGENDTSWKARFESKNIDVSWIDHGIGLLPGIEQIVIRHIEEAQVGFNP